MVQVGKVAPTFGAEAYHKGNFKNIDISENTGKWSILLFYPGDFTFV